MENSPPPIQKQPPQTSEFGKLVEKSVSILVKTFFFFFFGDHLNLGGKNLWISDFGRKITLNSGEDLFFFFFFFGDHLILGGKNLWISELSESFRLNFRTNRLKLIQDQWKFESRSLAHFSLFQNSPPPFPNPGYAPVRNQLPRSTMNRINWFHKILRAWKPRYCQALSAEDCDIRMEFGEMMLAWFKDWLDLLKNILKSAEAVFHIGGFVNRHNSHYWREKILVLPAKNAESTQSNGMVWSDFG